MEKFPVAVCAINNTTRHLAHARFQPVFHVGSPIQQGRFNCCGKQYPVVAIGRGNFFRDDFKRRDDLRAVLVHPTASTKPPVRAKSLRQKCGIHQRLSAVGKIQ